MNFREKGNIVFQNEGGGGSKAIWIFSENSSKMGHRVVPLEGGDSCNKQKQAHNRWRMWSMLSWTSSLSSRIGFLAGLSLSSLQSNYCIKNFPTIQYRTGHIKWAVAAGAIITLPGLAIMIGLVSKSSTQQRSSFDLYCTRLTINIFIFSAV